MFNLKKISKLLLMAAFVFAFMGLGAPQNANAQVNDMAVRHALNASKSGPALSYSNGRFVQDYGSKGKEVYLTQEDYDKLSPAEQQAAGTSYAIISKDKFAQATKSYQEQAQKKTPATQPQQKVTQPQDATKTLSEGDVLANEMEKEMEQEINKEWKDVVKAGKNGPLGDHEVTGCSANTGLFSNLIKTGRDIFTGLRDLIYVVAGFGIIGVAVGGFFGNLNWKWLGAIVIGLVVIASTGELINAITGCQDFTKSLITDTLK